MGNIHVNDPDDFATYPNHRICAVVDNRNDAQHTLEALLDSGIETEHVGILFGLEGADVLDADSTHHGVISRMAKSLRAFGDVENESMHIYESALRNGAYVFAVHARNEVEKETIRKALSTGNAREVNYFATWYVQAMKPN